tara:strand:- start:1539 stop:1919 length:381 start_codon:yes stop_codon:yes gene_type:complete
MDRTNKEAKPLQEGDPLRVALRVEVEDLLGLVLRDRLGHLLEELLGEPVEEFKQRRHDLRRALTVKETCAAYGFSRSTWDRIWAERLQNGLEGLVFRLGSKLLIPVPEFERWLRGGDGPQLAEGRP